MCGIAGIFEFDPAARADSRLLEQMTTLIAHRGPDDWGHVLRGNVGLGHRRLSIIDLSPGGHQPMSSEDGRVWITYNGECYNYPELAARLRSRGHRFRSSSDTEVILRLYLERGERFLEEVDGMFALAIWDERTQTLLLARDRIGIKPLYYFADRRRFLFASEMKALLADETIAIDIDPVALAHYFNLLSVPDPHSILKGIRKLLPGHYLTVSRRGVEKGCYWNLAVRPDSRASLEAVCAEFNERFTASVSSHTLSDVPVGAFLSGGVDSSAIVATAAPVNPSPIETFSITFPGLAEFDESQYAAAAAAHCGASHHEFHLTPNLIEDLPQIVWHADEPFAISSAFALFHLAKLARENVKVVLSGDGGDEVFAGYVWRHVDFPPMPKAAVAAASRAATMVAALGSFAGLLPQRWRKRLAHAAAPDERYLRSFSCFQSEDLAELLQPDAAAEMVEHLSENVVQSYLEQAPGEEQLARKLYTDIKTTLVSEMLTKVDRMTMAHGLEARVPFLDHHLVEWAFTVPGHFKLANNEGKLLVKKAMEGRLPRELLYRRKQGFNVPLKLWMRAELRPYIRDTFASARFKARGLYRPNAVEMLLERHFSGAADCSNKIFAMLMLELWYQQFTDRRQRYDAVA
jgi:asparagine synthase (glutamine-hydrolysing)